jgi:hypothetical protein
LKYELEKQAGAYAPAITSTEAKLFPPFSPEEGS